MSKYSSWKSKEAPTTIVHLYIAGNYRDIKKVAGRYVSEERTCVSIVPCQYMYPVDSEYALYANDDGARITLINYPRFPTAAVKLIDQLTELGFKIAEKLDQGSFSVVLEGGHTTWHSRRGDVE